MQVCQNGGSLSKCRRTGEFQKLRDDEVRQIEAIVVEAFENLTTDTAPNRKLQPVY